MAASKLVFLSNTQTHTLSLAHLKQHSINYAKHVPLCPNRAAFCIRNSIDLIAAECSYVALRACQTRLAHTQQFNGMAPCCTKQVQARVSITH